MPGTWTVTAVTRPTDGITCYCRLQPTSPMFVADYHASGDHFTEPSGNTIQAIRVALWASYFSFVPPPARKGEDGAIMRHRKRMENFYNTVLTSGQRANWDAYSAANPPRDAAGHSYVSGTPPTWYAVAVQPPTVYAWSQTFGVYRIGFQPILDPASVGFPTLTVTVLQAKLNRIIIAATCSGPTTDAHAILLYTTPPWDPLKAADPAALRPVSRALPDRFPRFFDITDELYTAWNVVMPGTFGLTLFAIDNNNQLTYNSTITQVTVTP